MVCISRIVFLVLGVFVQNGCARTVLMPHLKPASSLALIHNKPQQQQQVLLQPLDVRGGAGTGTVAGVTKVLDYIGASKTRCWAALSVAILIEIASTTLLNIASTEKSAPKFVVSMGMYLMSLLAFATSLPQIDVSIAYAVWSACGTALVSAVMILWFGEKADAVKISCISCIVVGVIGLNLRDMM